MFSFTRADRIRHRSEFVHITRFGKKLEDKYFIAAFCPGQTERVRLGVTITRKVGCAATRNRLKRLSREYFRMNKHIVNGVWDVNIIAKKAAADLTTEQVFSSLEGIFKTLSRRTDY